MTALISIFLLIAVMLVSVCHGDDIEHDHVIIHVPYYIKTIKHTRTLKLEAKPKEKNREHLWKVLGYSVGHPIVADDAFEESGFSQKKEGFLRNVQELAKALDFLKSMGY